MQEPDTAQQYIDVPKVDAKEAAKAMTGLRDIAQPAPVSWRPQTPAWYVLGVVIVVAMLAIAWRLVRRWRASQYRRDALAELDALEPALADPARRAAAINELSALVKRTRLTEAARPSVASLSGTAWLSDLDATWRAGTFTSGSGRLLADAAYASDGEIARISRDEMAQLTATIRRWISGHHAGAR